MERSSSFLWVLAFAVVTAAGATFFYDRFFTAPESTAENYVKLNLKPDFDAIFEQRLDNTAKKP